MKKTRHSLNKKCHITDTLFLFITIKWYRKLHRCSFCDGVAEQNNIEGEQRAEYGLVVLGNRNVVSLRLSKTRWKEKKSNMVVLKEANMG